MTSASPTIFGIEHTTIQGGMHFVGLIELAAAMLKPLLMSVAWVNRLDELQGDPHLSTV